MKQFIMEDVMPHIIHDVARADKEILGKKTCRFVLINETESTQLSGINAVDRGTWIVNLPPNDFFDRCNKVRDWFGSEETEGLINPETTIKEQVEESLPDLPVENEGEETEETLDE